MKRFLLLALTAGLLSPIPADAFWGLTKEESRICRQRASLEKNEFSAKQTFEYCKRNIKKELKNYKNSPAYIKQKEEEKQRRLYKEKKDRNVKRIWRIEGYTNLHVL